MARVSPSFLVRGRGSDRRGVDVLRDGGGGVEAGRAVRASNAIAINYLLTAPHFALDRVAVALAARHFVLAEVLDVDFRTNSLSPLNRLRYRFFAF